MWDALLVTLLAFGASVITTTIIIKFSAKRGVGLDHPSEAYFGPERRRVSRSKRTIHNKPVPRMGGVGCFIGMLASLFFVEIDRQFLILLLGGTFIFLVGLWDDLYRLRGRHKLIMISAGLFSIFWFSDLHIESLGNLFGTGKINLGPLGLPFTVFAVIGVISAINFMDGLNGLAGGLSLLTAVMMLGFGFFAVNNGLALLDCAMIGAVLGFLLFNFPHGKIFMGDSGSMLLGYWLGVFSVFLFGKGGSYEPTIAVLLLFIPIFDTLRVLVVRLSKSKNPFWADKGHIHHILYRSGVSHENVTMLLIVFATVPALFALLTRNFDGWKHLLFVLVYASLLGVLIEFTVKSRRLWVKQIKRTMLFQDSRKKRHPLRKVT